MEDISSPQTPAEAAMQAKADAKAEANTDLVRKTEIAISLVLRIGVGISVALVLAGLAVTFVQHSANAHFSNAISYHHFTAISTPFPHTFGELIHAISIGDGRGIIGLGLIVLILTPVLRVAVGVLSFIFEKDPRMAMVTAFVLIVLIASFFLGNA